MVAHASRTKLAAPRYVVRYRDRNSSEHRTVLAAMASALALVQAGHRSISVVDRRAAVVWRADRLGLTALLNLDSGLHAGGATISRAKRIRGQLVAKQQTTMKPGRLLTLAGASTRSSDGGHVPADIGSNTAPMVSAAWLEALAVRVKLRRTEWRVLAMILSSPKPMSALSIAKRLRLDYGLVKRVARELVLWSILERTAGLTFQPDHTRWGPPRPPSTTG